MSEAPNYIRNALLFRVSRLVEDWGAATTSGSRAMAEFYANKGCPICVEEAWTQVSEGGDGNGVATYANYRTGLRAYATSRAGRPSSRNATGCATHSRQMDVMIGIGAPPSGATAEEARNYVAHVDIAIRVPPEYRQRLLRVIPPHLRSVNDGDDPNNPGEWVTFSYGSAGRLSLSGLLAVSFTNDPAKWLMLDGAGKVKFWHDQKIDFTALEILIENIYEETRNGFNEKPTPSDSDTSMSGFLFGVYNILFSNCRTFVQNIIGKENTRTPQEFIPKPGMWFDFIAAPELDIRDAIGKRSIKELTDTWLRLNPGKPLPRSSAEWKGSSLPTNTPSATLVSGGSSNPNAGGSQGKADKPSKPSKDDPSGKSDKHGKTDGKKGDTDGQTVTRDDDPDGQAKHGKKDPDGEIVKGDKDGKDGKHGKGDGKKDKSQGQTVKPEDPDNSPPKKTG